MHNINITCNAARSFVLITCSALRGWLLSAYDVRACAIEVVWRWLGLVQPPGQPHQQQLQAMEALTIYCPLGHALGLGGCSAALEDAAFKVRGVVRCKW
jgi:(p)ppGpp synthase/HD superfamily hydrolase